MNRTSVFIAVLFAVTSVSADNPPPFVTAYAANSMSASLEPTNKSRPRNAGTRSELSDNSVMSRMALPVTDDPPPFGTIVQEWALQMGGTWAGAGITWRRDSGRFYLMDQEHRQVWSCDPFDPPGTERQENWVIPNLGTETPDIPWSIAWDSDSNCFWISNIVDGDIYGGCYYVRIRRSPVGDTWRWFSQFPGDTWLVGNGSSGGAGNMYWMAGAEKWPDRGYFAGVPVAEGSLNNRLWKFDPYSKTNLGRCQYGARYSERGVTLVPWDSNYILTAGWWEPYLVKRDSSGFPLDSAFGQEISDIALWIPQVIGPDDTVFVYSILNLGTNYFQKRSTGLLWSQLPSVNPHALSLSIVAPSGTIDSGQVVIPTLAVRNTGNEGASDVSVYFSIPDMGWCDSITGLNIPARTTETLSFSGWFPILHRDSMDAVAWACWAGDTYTTRNRFFVRVKDIAIPWYRTERDTYDSGEVVTAHARIENRGNVSLNCDIRFRYGGQQSTRNLNLIAGGATMVAPPWPFGGFPPGVYFLGTAWTDTVGDPVPGKNFAACTARVRGPIDHDYAVLRILEPTGEKDTLTPVAPSALVANLGAEPDSAAVTFGITFGDSVVMHNTTYCQLSPGDSIAVTFPVIRFTRYGTYVAACSVSLRDDQNFTNDEKVDTFYVGPVGIEAATHAPLRYGLSPIANPCRGIVTIRLLSPLPTPYSLSLYDATGRLVFKSPIAIRQSPFALDLRSMPVGVYVLRLNAGTFACSEKLILQH
jgi:hypothetical protein